MHQDAARVSPRDGSMSASVTERDAISISTTVKADVVTIGIDGPDDTRREIRFEPATAEAAPMGLPVDDDGTVLQDAAAIAVLPLAMRRGYHLAVRGAVSRTALRDLVDFSASYAAWKRELLVPSGVIAERILDLHPAPTGDMAAYLWDGSLEAAASLAHGLGGGPSAFRPSVIVHVSGIGDSSHDDSVRLAAAELARKIDVPLSSIRVASEGGPAFVDLIGADTLRAAALHLCASGAGIGILPRGWVYASLLGRIRPRPHVPDQFSGDRFRVLTAGGGSGAAQLVRKASAVPAVLEAIRPTSGSKARLASLGFAVAGISTPASARLPNPLVAAATLNLLDVDTRAEATLLALEPDRGAAIQTLRTALAVRRAGERAGDHWRWALSITGAGSPWPR